MLIPVLMFVAVGALFALLARPMMRRRVPPNSLYGLRVRATFADERVWYEANARSGRDLFALGLATIAAALALPLVPALRGPAYSLVMAGLLLVGSVAMGVRGWRTANRLLAERQEEERRSG